MNDPRVDVLTYDVSSQNPPHDYSEANMWRGTLADFDCVIDELILTAVPHCNFPDEKAAREALEPYLRAWELRSELEDGIPITFTFSQAKVIDRAPTPGSQTVAIGLVSELGLAGELTAVVRHSDYPSPSPKLLARTKFVEELLQLARAVRTRQEPMLAPAYLLLTRIEFEYGGRGAAASAINVSQKVLGKLGELTARNDPAERRKVSSPEKPLTEQERQWILAVVPLLVLQIAEIEAGLTPLLLGMARLPQL